MANPTEKPLFLQSKILSVHLRHPAFSGLINFSYDEEQEDGCLLIIEYNHQSALLVWFALVLWHINHCTLFNTKSFYTYDL